MAEVIYTNSQWETTDDPEQRPALMRLLFGHPAATDQQEVA